LSDNYGYDFDEEDAHPCTCGATNCCGYILAPQYWGLLVVLGRSIHTDGGMVS